MYYWSLLNNQVYSRLRKLRRCLPTPINIAGLITMLALALSGCVLLQFEQKPLRLSLSARAYSQADIIYLTLWGKNISDRPITLIFNGHAVHDFIVTKPDGTEVWRWSHRKVFLPLPRVKILNPHEQFEFATEWEQVDNEGRPVPPGTYWVRGVLYTEPTKRFETKPERLILKPRLPLLARLDVPTGELLWAFGEYVVQLGQRVPLKLKVKNRSDQPVELTLSSRPAYDLIVTPHDSASTIWSWTYGKFIQRITERRILQAGEELEFTAEWDQQDNGGTPIPPGKYVVRGVVYLEPLQQLETEPIRLVIGEGLPLRLELEMPFEVRIDEAVSLKLKVTNASDRALDLLVISPPWDFVVTRADGNEVWRWARGKAFPATLFPLTLHPGETKVYETSWDQMDNEGYPVLPGTYWVWGIFGASQSGIDGVPELARTEPQKLVIRP